MRFDTLYQDDIATEKKPTTVYTIQDNISTEL